MSRNQGSLKSKAGEVLTKAPAFNDVVVPKGLRF